MSSLRLCLFVLLSAAFAYRIFSVFHIILYVLISFTIFFLFLLFHPNTLSITSRFFGFFLFFLFSSILSLIVYSFSSILILYLILFVSSSLYSLCYHLCHHLPFSLLHSNTLYLFLRSFVFHLVSIPHLQFFLPHLIPDPFLFVSWSLSPRFHLYSLLILFLHP